MESQPATFLSVKPWWIREVLSFLPAFAAGFMIYLFHFNFARWANVTLEMIIPWIFIIIGILGSMLLRYGFLKRSGAAIAPEFRVVTAVTACLVMGATWFVTIMRTTIVYFHVYD